MCGWMIRVRLFNDEEAKLAGDTGMDGEEN